MSNVFDGFDCVLWSVGACVSLCVSVMDGLIEGEFEIMDVDEWIGG